MFSFLPKKQAVGIEITSSSVRVVALSGGGPKASVLFAKTVDLPWGLVTESYAAPNIADTDALSSVLRECLAGLAHLKIRRAALSLPDSIFRVQTLEFDQLPDKTVEQERLIRWRIQKASAFDIAGSLLRYQFLKRQDTGFTVLACVSKQAVISQYESIFAGLGLELWSVGLSSFNTLNFYSPYLSRKATVSALAHVAGDSFTTIITEGGGVRFYRFKEIKKAGAEEGRARLMRELEDSLHFYTHMDRSQQSDIGQLFLTGEPSVFETLARGFTDKTALEVEALSPSAVLVSSGATAQDGELPAVMAAALGAGGAL